MRKIPSMLALLSITVAVAGQGPAEKLDALLLPEIERRLASDDAADVAWGGYLVHRYRLRAAQRQVIEALRRWCDDPDDEARFVRVRLLDALLGSEAKVPGEELEALLEDRMTRDAAVALLVTDPAANFTILERIALSPADSGDQARVVAGRVLLQRDLHSHALATHVLQLIEPRFVVDVIDGEERSGPWNSAVGLGGGARLRQPRGFPPLLELKLTWLTAGMERVVWANPVEDEAIGLGRREASSFTAADFQRGETDLLPQYELERWLGSMARMRFQRETRLSHRFVDAATMLRELGAKRDEQRAELDRVLAKVRKNGWLGPEDLPGFRLPLTEVVRDERDDKSVALPQLPPPPALDR